MTEIKLTSFLERLQRSSTGSGFSFARKQSLVSGELGERAEEIAARLQTAAGSVRIAGASESRFEKAFVYAKELGLNDSDAARATLRAVQIAGGSSDDAYSALFGALKKDGYTAFSSAVIAREAGKSEGSATSTATDLLFQEGMTAEEKDVYAGKSDGYAKLSSATSSLDSPYGHYYNKNRRLGYSEEDSIIKTLAQIRGETGDDDLAVSITLDSLRRAGYSTKVAWSKLSSAAPSAAGLYSPTAARTGGSTVTANVTALSTFTSLTTATSVTTATSLTTATSVTTATSFTTVTSVTTATSTIAGVAGALTLAFSQGAVLSATEVLTFAATGIFATYSAAARAITLAAGLSQSAVISQINARYGASGSAGTSLVTASSSSGKLVLTTYATGTSATFQVASNQEATTAVASSYAAYTAAGSMTGALGADEVITFGGSVFGGATHVMTFLDDGSAWGGPDNVSNVAYAINQSTTLNTAITATVSGNQLVLTSKVSGTAGAFTVSSSQATFSAATAGSATALYANIGTIWTQEVLTFAASGAFASLATSSRLITFAAGSSQSAIVSQLNARYGATGTAGTSLISATTVSGKIVLSAMQSGLTAGSFSVESNRVAQSSVLGSAGRVTAQQQWTNNTLAGGCQIISFASGIGVFSGISSAGILNITFAGGITRTNAISQFNAKYATGGVALAGGARLSMSTVGGYIVIQSQVSDGTQVHFVLDSDRTAGKSNMGLGDVPETASLGTIGYAESSDLDGLSGTGSDLLYDHIGIGTTKTTVTGTVGSTAFNHVGVGTALLTAVAGTAGSTATSLSTATSVVTATSLSTATSVVTATSMSTATSVVTNTSYSTATNAVTSTSGGTTAIIRATSGVTITGANFFGRVIDVFQETLLHGKSVQRAMQDAYEFGLELGMSEAEAASKVFSVARNSGQSIQNAGRDLAAAIVGATGSAVTARDTLRSAMLVSTDGYITLSENEKQDFAAGVYSAMTDRGYHASQAILAANYVVNGTSNGFTWGDPRKLRDTAWTIARRGGASDDEAASGYFAALRHQGFSADAAYHATKVELYTRGYSETGADLLAKPVKEAWSLFGKNKSEGWGYVMLGNPYLQSEQPTGYLYDTTDEFL